MFSGHVPERRGSGIGPWQQIVDLAVGMAVDDLGDDVGEVGVRFDAEELAGLDQRGDDGPMLAAAVGAGEECVLAVQRDRPDRAFDDVGVDLDAAVVEEAGEPLPARERIADRFGELCLLTDQSELGAQPGFEFIDDRPALRSLASRLSSAPLPRISSGQVTPSPPLVPVGSFGQFETPD